MARRSWSESVAADGTPSPDDVARSRGFARPVLLAVTVLLALLLLGSPVAPPEAAGQSGATGQSQPPSGAAGQFQPPVGEPAGSEASTATAAARLRRAEQAGRQLDWRGTQFVARWSDDLDGSSDLVDVAHVQGRGHFVRSASGGGELAFVPESPTTGPGLGPLTLLERHYVLHDGGAGRSAGRDADVVEVWHRSDPQVLAARFWLDQATGLVLRREVLDVSGRVLLASALLDLRATGEPGTDVVEPVPSAPDDPADDLSAVTAEALREEGWSVPAVLAGLELHESRASGHGDDRLVLLAYSDGLFNVSVFAQPGRLDAPGGRDWELRELGGTAVWASRSLPRRVAWAVDGKVLTVVADAPTETVEDVVAGLPRPGQGLAGKVWEGGRERLARGLHRVASWVGPSPS